MATPTICKRVCERITEVNHSHGRHWTNVSRLTVGITIPAYAYINTFALLFAGEKYVVKSHAFPDQLSAPPATTEPKLRA